MSFIVIIPAMIAVYIASTRSLQEAFLNVYIPVLLFIPTYYTWKISGLPDPNFQGAVVLAIAGLFLLKGLPGWRFSATDVLVFGFAITVSISAYVNEASLKPPDNIMAGMLMSVIFPYLLAKSLVEPSGLGEECAKRFVLVLCVVALFLIYEMLLREGYTLWQRALGRFFGQGWARTVNYRWGLTRANGPYDHPIQAGMIMVVAFSLQWWLAKRQAWSSLKQRFKLPISFLLTLLLLGGLFAPLSRGPWLSFILASLIIFALTFIIRISPTVLHRYLIVGIFMGIVGIGGIASYEIFSELTASRQEVSSTKDDMSHERQTVAYRADLYRTYGDLVLQRWAWGWGFGGWPKDKGQRSIDNHYIWTALAYGLIAVVYFITLILYIVLRLFLYIMNQPKQTAPEKSIALTLLSLFMAYLFFMGTVSIQETNQTILFVLIGWGESYLITRRHTKKVTEPGIAKTSYPKTPFVFNRTL